MDLQSIFVSNGVGIFILLILLYASRARTLQRSAEDRIYTMMVVGVMLGCFMEAFSYSIDGRMFPGSRLLNYIANTYLYCVNVLLPFCVLVYIDLGIYGDPKRITQRYKPQIIVGVIMIAANVVNYIIPITYYITDANVYERRPFSYVYYIVILYYLISAFILTRRYEKENGARAFFNVMVFLVPILIGAALQFAFYGLSLAWLAAAIGLVGLFMMQQNELAYVDMLVDTYNRQFLNYVLSAWTARGKSFEGVMLDVDDFKCINDNFGHAQGDVALQAVTNILKESRIDNELVFRYAGDEFIVLKMADAPGSLDAYMDNVEKNLDEYNSADHPYQLALSYGTSYYGDGSSTDAFIKEMDDGMYAMKVEHHRAAKM